MKTPIAQSQLSHDEEEKFKKKEYNNINSRACTDEEIQNWIYKQCTTHGKEFNIPHYNENQKRDSKNNNEKQPQNEEDESTVAKRRAFYLEDEDDPRSMEPRLTKPVVVEITSKKNSKQMKTMQTEETANTNYAEGFREKTTKKEQNVLKNVKFGTHLAKNGTKSYTTSYIRLCFTVEQLLSSIGSEFCRKNGFDEEIYRNLIGSLVKKNVRCNFSPNIQECMIDFEEYVEYNIANKLNKNGANTVKNQEKALINDTSNGCCFLNVDVLFEDPTRIIQKFIEECQFSKTREQKILLGKNCASVRCYIITFVFLFHNLIYFNVINQQ